MSKYDAFGTVINVGTSQVETAVIVGTITGNGNATFTLTVSGMTGTPIATSVAVLNGDVPATTATKAAAAMNLNADITALCSVVANGPNVIVTKLIATANDATMNLAYTNDTCTGLTPDATSNDTTAGVALTAIAQVSSISGPSLSLDTEDVTTHDSTGAWEEVVGTILRGGEITLDIVYDPALAGHGATTGLLDRQENRTLSDFSVVFSDGANTTWNFDGFVTGFEPSMPVDGALTASVTIKTTGVMTLV